MNEFEGRTPRELEPTLGDIVDGAMRKLVTAIVIAGGLIAFGLYSQAGPARYQMVAADGRVFRLNTGNGTVVGCENNHCAILLRHNQDFEDSLPAPPPPPRQIAPPPAAAPAPAPTPALSAPVAPAPVPSTR